MSHLSSDPIPGASSSQTHYSDNFGRTFRLSLAIAEERHREFATPEHLLLALTDDPDAASVMQACDVDLDALRVAVSSSLPSLATSGHTGVPGPDARFQAIVQRAAIHVQSIGKKEISGAHVLAAMLVSIPREPITEFLSNQGVTWFDAVSYISHGLRKGEAMPALDSELAAGAAMLEVRLLNDDYTPMEFVVEVLERIFDQDRETAVRTMLWAHSSGIAACGIYPLDIATAKVAQVLEFARAHQHPLRCVTAAVRR
jgi:ATP-dependent Clp protease adapter protein ClpS